MPLKNVFTVDINFIGKQNFECKTIKNRCLIIILVQKPMSANNNKILKNGKIKISCTNIVNNL